MKKVILMSVLLCLTTVVMADAAKGKRYYMKSFKQKFKMDGLSFVQLHTRAEWKVLFENKGKGFIAEFSEKYPKQGTYLHDPKTWKKLQHVGDFAIEYASDSGKIPTCGDDSMTEAPIDLKVKESSSANFFE